MPAKQFYLLGEPVSSARNIDVDPTSDLDDIDVPGGGDGLSKEIKLLCRHYA
jgi:hypothetical protein